MATREQEYFIINRFMGVDRDGDCMSIPNDVTGRKIMIKLGEENYDKDYNRLMAVVEKLEDVLSIEIIISKHHVMASSLAQGGMWSYPNKGQGRTHGLYQLVLFLIRLYNNQQNK